MINISDTDKDAILMVQEYDQWIKNLYKEIAEIKAKRTEKINFLAQRYKLNTDASEESLLQAIYIAYAKECLNKEECLK